MAFTRKFGGLFKQVITSNPSLYQAIRCISSSQLFVGGISLNTDEQSMREAFASYGEVVEAKVITDQATGRSRGFGFVTFNSSEEAYAAINGMDGKDLHGHTIRVNYATDRMRRPRNSSCANSYIYGYGDYEIEDAVSNISSVPVGDNTGGDQSNIKDSSSISGFGGGFFNFGSGGFDFSGGDQSNIEDSSNISGSGGGFFDFGSGGSDFGGGVVASLTLVAGVLISVGVVATDEKHVTKADGVRVLDSEEKLGTYVLNFSLEIIE